MELLIISLKFECKDTEKLIKNTNTDKKVIKSLEILPPNPPIGGLLRGYFLSPL